MAATLAATTIETQSIKASGSNERCLDAPPIMKQKSKPLLPHLVSQLSRCPTGIRGLDEMTGGGLRQGRQVTSLFTSLTHIGMSLQSIDASTSSPMDAWMLLQDFAGNGERNGLLYVLKAPGMAHSNLIREFIITHPKTKLPAGNGGVP